MFSHMTSFCMNASFGWSYKRLQQQILTSGNIKKNPNNKSSFVQVWLKLFLVSYCSLGMGQIINITIYCDVLTCDTEAEVFSSFSAHIYNVSTVLLFVNSACSQFVADIWHLKNGTRVHAHVLRIVLKAYAVSSQLSIKLWNWRNFIMNEWAYDGFLLYGKTVSVVYFPLHLHRLRLREDTLQSSKKGALVGSTAQNTLILIWREDERKWQMLSGRIAHTAHCLHIYCLYPSTKGQMPKTFYFT